MSMNFSKGVTLVELIVAIAIFSIVSIAIGNFISDIYRNNSYASGSLQASQDGRSILRPMVNEIRTMTLGANGSYPIALAGTSTIIFYTDIDADGVTERVRYFLQNDELRKGVIEASGNPIGYTSGTESLSTLARAVRNSTTTNLFEYYDSEYSGSSTTSALSFPIDIPSVRLIKIDLVLDADPNRSPTPRSYTTQVNIRNLKDNL